MRLFGSLPRFTRSWKRSRGLVEEWCTLLKSFAAKNNFRQTRIWLISNEGFTDEALAVLDRDASLWLRPATVGATNRPPNVRPSQTTSQAADADEFVMILPMGEDNELVAAETVEQIARTTELPAGGDQSNQTAIVEACINASEHSFSPDRKIYQRFRVESDRLTITIASRGVSPANVSGKGRGRIRPANEEVGDFNSSGP